MLFLEPKSLLSTKGPVPVGEHYIPFGQAKVVRAGHRSDDRLLRRLAAPLAWRRPSSWPPQGVSCEVIDLRTIVPLDVETIVASVAKTGRLLVVDEAHAMCGIGAELAAVVMEHAFDELDAPGGPAAHRAGLPAVQLRPLEERHCGERREDRRRGAFRDRRPAADPAACRGPVAQDGRAADRRGDGQCRCQPRADGRRCRAGAETGCRDGSPDGVPIIMPNMDLIITEATVVAWLKKVGDPVRQGEASWKSKPTRRSPRSNRPADGVLAEILADEGTVIPLGGRLGTIRP